MGLPYKAGMVYERTVADMADDDDEIIVNERTIAAAQIENALAGFRREQFYDRTGEIRNKACVS